MSNEISDQDRLEIEAAVYRRLVDHLQKILMCKILI